MAEMFRHSIDLNSADRALMPYETLAAIIRPVTLHNCQEEVPRVIKVFRMHGLCRDGRGWRIPGPVTHPNCILHQMVTDEYHHTVAELDAGYIIDIYCEPGQRVYKGRDDYLERSGTRVEK